MRTSEPTGGDGVGMVVRRRLVRYGPRRGRVQARMVGGRDERVVAMMDSRRW